MRTTFWGASFGLALSISVTGLFLTECSDDNLGTGAGSGDAAAGCPTNPPTPGTSCLLANGTICNSYPQPGCACCAGNSGYECTNGKWEQLPSAAGAQPGFACPATVPEAGSPCSTNPCGGSDPACSYDCTTGNGFAATASCPNGTWEVDELAIPCNVDFDAGDGGDASDGS